MRPTGFALILSAVAWVHSAGAQKQELGSIRSDERAGAFEVDSAPPAEFDESPQARAANTEASEVLPPAPYSVPWQLRSVTPRNALRLEHVATPYRSASEEGFVRVTALAASYEFVPSVAVTARGALITDSPATEHTTNAFANPIFGAIWGAASKPLRYAISVSLAPPVGSGGGNDPAPSTVAANRAGHLARFAMDGSLFAVNYVTAGTGADLAYVADGLTVQVEMTVTQSLRSRGEREAPDEYRANLLSGLHAGYWVLDELCIASELRYQRWLSSPKAIQGNALNQQNLSVEVGLRTSISSGSAKMLPSIAYATGLYGEVAEQRMHAMHVDVPFVF